MLLEHIVNVSRVKLISVRLIVSNSICEVSCLNIPIFLFKTVVDIFEEPIITIKNFGKLFNCLFLLGWLTT